MKCEIRSWRYEDKEALAKLLNNPRILCNLRDGIPYPYTQADAEAYIRSVLEADQDSVFAYAITAGDALIGNIGLFRGSDVHRRTAELGYYLAEEYWGQGYMTDAVSQVCRRMFESTDIVRIYAEVYAFNAASCRVLEKAGFCLEGTLRCHAFKNGRVEDVRLYARIKPGFRRENPETGH